MARLDWVMQGKGGVGKSAVASLLTQYYWERLDKLPFAIDTDPLNQTLSKYRAFGALVFELLDDRREVDPANFEKMLKHIDTLEPERRVVVDSGATTFINLVSYLQEGEVLDVLHEDGHEVMLHVVIAGGQEQDDTLGGLAYLLRTFERAKFVVWLNHFHALIRHGNQTFLEMPLYLDNRGQIQHVVDLPLCHGLISRNLSDMFTSHLTFKEALCHPKSDSYVKRRLKVARQRFYEAMEQSGFVDG